jgi:hypothetical protein
MLLEMVGPSKFLDWLFWWVTWVNYDEFQKVFEFGEGGCLDCKDEGCTYARHKFKTMQRDLREFWWSLDLSNRALLIEAAVRKYEPESLATILKQPIDP